MVQLQELGRIQQDWQKLQQRMEELSGKLGHIKATIAKAAATDLAASQFAGIPGFAMVTGQLIRDVGEIKDRAEHLQQTKETLTKELAGDVEKIKQVIGEYQGIEHKLEEELKKKVKGGGDQPKSPGTGGGPQTGIDGAGGAKGGSGGSGGHQQPKSPGGGGDGGGSGSGTRDDYPQGHGTGDWKTTGNWDAWSPGKHHTTTGAGVKAEPKTEGLSKERKDAVDRALERINHRIGYSQSAFTNGYRDDCSGFVSAAWGLPGPGLNTWGLMKGDVAHRIGKDDLQPGDALIAGGHTVLFGGWADAAHTRYIGLEDNGSQGTVSQVIPYPYFPGSAGEEARSGSPYLPFRRNGMQ
ncbi:hypothetical protein AB0K43_21925 [Kitasatospora sp. NPDC049258]|uniref:hypothetical protein n=1 Tax=Kitasatospora sp. NPDC049258 TaxID=3155394 RepID=UPI0034164BCE